MKINQTINRERGAALVEFAVVVPLLLLLLMGAIEIGLLFYNQQVLTNASREGARAGIARPPGGESEIIQIAEDYCEDRLIRFDDDIAPTVTASGVNGAYGEDLTVSVNYDYVFLLPSILGFNTNLFDLTAVTTMKMEWEISP